MVSFVIGVKKFPDKLAIDRFLELEMQMLCKVRYILGEHNAN
jgi:hypothetical protein